MCCPEHNSPIEVSTCEQERTISILTCRERTDGVVVLVGGLACASVKSPECNDTFVSSCGHSKHDIELSDDSNGDMGNRFCAVSRSALLHVEGELKDVANTGGWVRHGV